MLPRAARPYSGVHNVRVPRSLHYRASVRAAQHLPVSSAETTVRRLLANPTHRKSSHHYCRTFQNRNSIFHISLPPPLPQVLSGNIP
ncbi:MAG: toxin-antitoxin system HicB family antitoxin [Spirochaetes bacterium]|nr:toxin-antitoxin system HicB family antitoxin [Spirochaetota bacterium]